MLIATWSHQFGFCICCYQENCLGVADSTFSAKTPALSSSVWPRSRSSPQMVEIEARAEALVSVTEQQNLGHGSSLLFLPTPLARF